MYPKVVCDILVGSKVDRMHRKFFFFSYDCPLMQKESIGKVERITISLFVCTGLEKSFSYIQNGRQADRHMQALCGSRKMFHF